VYPKAGVLAPKAEKVFVRGVTAYMQGKLDEALVSFNEVQERDSEQGHVAEEFFAGVCLVGLGRLEEAVPYLETVLASDHPIPDPLMGKYGVAGDMLIGVTPLVNARVPMSNLATALMLAEVYQNTDQSQKAIDLLESLGSQAPDEPVFALSLADLYDQSDQWDDVLRVTEGVNSNEDDVTLNILVLRAFALNELGLTEAALVLTKEALRTKKRSPDLLHLARYVRGRSYESAGKAGMARKEYERIFAENSKFMDVSERLGREPSSSSSAPPRPDV
jgi:tetratricopeptide (TPR) repeat protein